MDPIIQQWLERAQYDLETARSLLKSGRYLYVAFMCQQTVEKLLKGYISSQGKTPPFVHSLVRLSEEAKLLAEATEDQKQLFADLNPFYIKARYGEYKEALAKVCTKEHATTFLKKVEEFDQWLRPKFK